MLNSELSLRIPNNGISIETGSKFTSTMSESSTAPTEEQLVKERAKQAILSSMLKHSFSLLGSATTPTSETPIQHKMHLIEERVYLQQTKEPSDYFHALFNQFKETNPFMNNIMDKVGAITKGISNKIESGEIEIQKRIIPLTKAEIKALSTTENIYTSRMMRSSEATKASRFLNNSSLDKSRMTMLTDQEKSMSLVDPKQQLIRFKSEQELIRKNLEERKKKDEMKVLLLQQKEDELKAEKRKQRAEDLEKSLARQQEERLSRAEEMKRNQDEFSRFQKNYKEKKPLYLILEENFTEEKEIKVQQEKLQKIREIYKPHRLEDFEDHLKRYKDHQKSEQERILQKKNAFLSSKNALSNHSLWRGKAHEIVEQELKESLRHSASEDKKMRKEREKSYSKLIKTNFVVTVDDKKRKEVTNRIEEFITPKNIIKKLIKSHQIESEPNSYKLGLENFELAKKFAREHRKQAQSEFGFVTDVVESATAPKRTTHDSNFTEAHSNTVPTKIKYKNYMREEKVKGLLKKEHPVHEWESQMSKLSGTDKVEKVLITAQMLDVQAQRKEKMIKHSKNVTANQIEDLDDLYYNSIKAKMALLKEAHDLK